jgi:hypothetical protein
MYMSLITSIVFLFCATNAFAAQKAVVVTEGAIVYRKPNFDAPVIGYFQRGKRVSISTKLYGPFHRVKFKQGLVGYISDVDVATDQKAKISEPKDSKDKDKKHSKTKKGGPPWQAIAAGPVFGFVQFSELINSEELNSKVTVMGLQLSTPFTLLEGPFSLTTTFLYHSGAPTYYDTVSSTPPSGTIMFLDSLLTFPIGDFMNGSGSLLIGAGPLITQSSFKATIGARTVDLQETKLGLSIAGGVAYKLAPIIIRAEAKYFVEKASYFGAQASLQYVFR